MESIERVFIFVTRNMDRIAGLVVLPLVSWVVIIDVFLRYAFNSPFIWSLEFNEWFLLGLFAFAIPECTRQNGHIRMELMVSHLSPRLQAYFDSVYVACGIAVFFLLGRHTWEEFLFDYEFGRVTEFLGLPIWGQQLVILSMCVVLTIYYVMRLIASILGSKNFSRTDAVKVED